MDQCPGFVRLQPLRLAPPLAYFGPHGVSGIEGKDWATTIQSNSIRTAASPTFTAGLD